MRVPHVLQSTLRVPSLVFLIILAPSPAGKYFCRAQSLPQIGANSAAPKLNDPEPLAPAKSEPSPIVGERASPPASQSQFRAERISIANGAELLTIFGRINQGENGTDVPLLSVVRDTLGDATPENDRLRYVWMLTYAKPTLRQRLAAAVPFLYHRVGNKIGVSTKPPPVLLNVASANRNAGGRFVWFGLQHLLLDTNGLPLRLASRSYRRNWSDYYSAHVTQALSILSNYDRSRSRAIAAEEMIASLQRAATTTEGVLPDVTAAALIEEAEIVGRGSSSSMTPADSLETKARLILSNKSLGSLVRSEKFRAVVEKYEINSSDAVGHNWELLRQRAEAEGLYFEPLNIPDGTSTHAVLWIARSDLATPHQKNFDARFLNVTNPWQDERLQRWHGYVQTRYFDADNRPVAADTAGARPTELIPLAVYGLDNPKIPTLLVDFRDGLNPKKREVSGRAWRDVASNVLSLSPLSLPYFVGRSTFDWITRRRGMDINQPTRLSSYSRLKLLLSLNSTIDPGLRAEIDRRLEKVSPDPLTNDRQAEVLLAKEQFKALLDFAARPDGLAAKIERDRGAEMMPLKHGRAARFFFRLANAVTFGRYVHRETVTPELMERMEKARRVDYHVRFLRETTASSPQVEVTSNLVEVKHSLEFVRDNAAHIGKAGAGVAARVFRQTEDTETRQLCIEVLLRISNKAARNELMRILYDPHTSAQWRAAVAESVRKSVFEDQKLTPAQARALLNQIDGK